MELCVEFSEMGTDRATESLSMLAVEGKAGQFNTVVRADEATSGLTTVDKAWLSCCF